MASYAFPFVVITGTSCALLALWISVVLLTQPLPENETSDIRFIGTVFLLLVAVLGLWIIYGQPRLYLWFLTVVVVLLFFTVRHILSIGRQRLLSIPVTFLVTLIIIPFVLAARTPGFLHESVAVGDTRHTRVLLMLGADPNNQPYNDSMLNKAIHDVQRPYGVPEMVRLLLAYGANPNTSNTSFRPALQYAVYHGEFEIAFDLLRAGALPEYEGDRGASLLRWGAYYGNNEFLSTVLTLPGVDVNSRLRYSGRSALFETTNKETAEFLLANGANQYLRTYQGETLLHWHARFGNPEILRYWLNKGISPESKDYEGRTPLISALLPLAEQNAECPDMNGRTAIQVLAKHLEPEDVERQQALVLIAQSPCESIKTLIE